MFLPDEALALLERQFGVIGRFQLVEIMPSWQIDALLRRKLLVPVERGVYRTYGSVSTPRQQAMAALLRARPGACLTGPFVLGLFDVDGFTVNDQFEVLTQPGRDLRGVRFAHRKNPTPHMPSARLGELVIAPVTAALVDVGRWLGQGTAEDRRLRVAYDQCRWRGLTSEAKLTRRLEEVGDDDPGVRRFAILRQEFGLRPESEGERTLGTVVRAVDPQPEPQVWIGSCRIDWYWATYRFGIEYQGGIDHVSVADTAYDESRRQQLEAQGIKIWSIVFADLANPEALVARLYTALVMRARELGTAPPTLLEVAARLAS